MTVPEEALAPAAEFPAASREDWQRLVAGVLAKSGRPGLEGAAAEQALATEVEDGLRVQPLYTAQDPAPEAEIKIEQPSPAPVPAAAPMLEATMVREPAAAPAASQSTLAAS